MQVSQHNSRSEAGRQQRGGIKDLTEGGHEEGAQAESDLKQSGRGKADLAAWVKHGREVTFSSKSPKDTGADTHFGVSGECVWRRGQTEWRKAPGEAEVAVASSG